MQCSLCKSYVHDCIESAIPALAPKRPLSVRPMIQKAVVEYARVFAVCMKHPRVYEQIRDTLKTMLEFHGEDAAADGLLASIPILSSSLAFLAGEMADRIGLQEEAVLGWFKIFSLRLIVDLLDVHKMHTKEIPFQDPAAKKRVEKVEETLADETLADEMLEEPDPLYS